MLLGRFFNYKNNTLQQVHYNYALFCKEKPNNTQSQQSNIGGN